MFGSEKEGFKAAFEKLSELESCFPSIAPRLIVNITYDLDLFTGFETPLLRVMAKHQVPVLVDAFVQCGAFVQDDTRKCGLKPVLPPHVTSHEALVSEETRRLFKDYAGVVSDRISKGSPYKLAAVNIPLTDEMLEKVQSRIMPVLKQFAAAPDVEGGVGVKLMFGFVKDKV